MIDFVCNILFKAHNYLSCHFKYVFSQNTDQQKLNRCLQINTIIIFL